MLVVHQSCLPVLLLQVLGVLCEPVHQGMECDGDKSGTLCLTKDYSTFDLPFRAKPNLIKIGKNSCSRNTNKMLKD